MQLYKISQPHLSLLDYQMADTTSAGGRRVWPAIAGLLVLVVGPVALSVFLYLPPGFNPAPPPANYSFDASICVPERHDRILGDSDRIGEGLLPGPEDLSYDAEGGFIYTGCNDGWIRRVKLREQEAVEDWVHVGGRPLGVAFSPDGSLVVAEAHKGLMMVKPNKEVHLLTDEAEGVKFRLTDGVDVSSQRLIYFTDASHKYNLNEDMLDIFELRPHGRLLSFDPSTNKTTVLIRDLYFANGVSLSPDESSLIFCETVLRRCRRYHIQGEKKGIIENFIENLPGFPDNIHYDGEGRYWIALASGRSPFWDSIQKSPILRKMMVVAGNFMTSNEMKKNSGVLSVTLDGKPLALYSDPELHLVTGGLRIGKYLYYGSLEKPYISKILLSEEAAKPL